MKKYSLTFFILFTITLFSQKDSLNIESKYWEDQLYTNITFNILNDQPEEVSSSQVSYGVSFGYIKDIPLNRDNTFALGVGLGYNYDFFTHGLVVDETGFSVNEEVSSNKLKLHNIEIPIQIRWRTSDAVSYSFWRVYLGVKMNYNIYNKFSYELDDEIFVYRDIDNYNNLQTGLELSVGYGAFNLYTYYGVSPMLKNAYIDDEQIKTKILKLGLIFYLL